MASSVAATPAGRAAAQAIAQSAIPFVACPEFWLAQCFMDKPAVVIPGWVVLAGARAMANGISKTARSNPRRASKAKPRK
jgi:hypothetical protein